MTEIYIARKYTTQLSENNANKLKLYENKLKLYEKKLDDFKHTIN